MEYGILALGIVSVVLGGYFIAEARINPKGKLLPSNVYFGYAAGLVLLGVGLGLVGAFIGGPLFAIAGVVVMGAAVPITIHSKRLDKEMRAEAA